MHDQEEHPADDRRMEGEHRPAAISGDASADSLAMTDRRESGQRRADDGRFGTSPESSSFSPIIRERRLRRSEILVRRQVRAHVGLVLVTVTGTHYFPPEKQPTIGELFWKGGGTLFEIDMGQHWTPIELDMPSQSEAFSFHATADVEWRVENPLRIVTDGVHDIRTVLRTQLWQRLSPITRAFEIEDSANAEAAAAASLADLPIGTEYGLRTRVFLRLRMDALAVEHASAVRDVRREIALERDTQVLRLLREESRAALIDRRITRYRSVLLSGDFDQFALQLAHNPDEVPAVIQMLREERNNNRRAVTDFVTHLLDSGAIDRHEISDQVRNALQWVKDASDPVLAAPGASDRTVSTDPPLVLETSGNAGKELPETTAPKGRDTPKTEPNGAHEHDRIPSETTQRAAANARTADPGGDDDGRLWIRAQIDPEVALGRHSAVLVTLARETLRVVASAARAAAPFPAEPDQKLTIEVVPVANLAIVGSDKAYLVLPEPGEPHRLRFTVRATHTGLGELWVMVSQGQVPLRTLKLTSTVTDLRCVDDGEIVLRPPSTPVHVLRIIEQRQGDAVRYRYDIEAPDLGLLETYSSELIEGDRDAYVRALYARIERFWLDTNGDLDRFQEELRAFGAEMLDQLVPRELQSVLWQHRHELRNVMVLSTEPFIPWELVHLTDPSEPTLLPKETAFLGQQGVVRWRWRHWPQERLRLRPGQARVIAPDYPEPYRLDQAASERKYLRETFGAEEVEPHHASVLALLRSGAFDLLHFVGHGAASVQSIADAQLLLEGSLDADGQYRSEPLRVSVVAKNLRCDRSAGGPIVFLNACQTGRLGQQLTSIGGFAQAFLDAGAGIFVSSLWSVGDAPAKEFAVAFYDALREGQTASEAAATGRAVAREAGDATWLAYAVYAHPAARISLTQ